MKEQNNKCFNGRGKKTAATAPPFEACPFDRSSFPTTMSSPPFKARPFDRNSFLTTSNSPFKARLFDKTSFVKKQSIHTKQNQAKKGKYVYLL